MSDVQQSLALAAAALEEDDAETAIHHARAATAADPTLEQGWRLLSIAHHQRGEPHLALEIIDRGLRQAGDPAELYYQRGVVLQDLGREHEAQEAYTHTVTRQPDHAWAWVNLGRLLDDDFEHAEAVACYDRALTLGDDEIAWTNRGNSLLALERFEEALHSFERALDLTPDSGASRLGATSALIELGRMDEANAIELPPGFARGVACECTAGLVDGSTLVLRYRTGRHTRPEWLAEEAEQVVRRLASTVDALPEPRTGHTLPYLMSWFTLRQEADDRWVLCEPDWGRDPSRHRRGTISFTLQALVMMNLLHQTVEAPLTPVSWRDTVRVSPALHELHEVVVRRRNPARDGVSGWWLGPADPDVWTAQLDRFVAVPASALLVDLPHLTKPLTLPVGWTAHFEGHQLVSVTDAEDRERWDRD